MTVSIRTMLAQKLVGAGAALEWDAVTEYLRKEYVFSDEHKRRVEMHERRDTLYTDGGKKYIDTLIDKVFIDPNIRESRKKWAEFARFNNPLKRIVNEISTVYQRPAKRQVDGDVNNATYQELQRRCRQHEQFRRLNRLLNLHRALLVGFRVRNVGSEEEPRLEPVIDIVTPGRCFAVEHPNDPSHLIAVGIRIKTRYARRGSRDPAWLVWTDHERFHLDSDGRMIDGTLVEHEFARMPWVFVSLEPPGDSLWPGDVGEDLVAAHMAIWFSSVCLLKETKSATKTAVLSGDMTDMARAQAADTDGPVEVPDGVAVNQIDLSMDLKVFLGTSNHVLDTAANNYGMSAGLVRHQGVQSAAARDLMRVPLREIRLEQHEPLRQFEREFAEVQAMVLAEDMPELAFDPDGWRLDYADPQTPRSVKEQLEEFEHARKLTLDSTLAFVMRQNPDLDEEQARTVIEAFVADELWRNEALRPLQEISGSPREEWLAIHGPTANTTGGEPPTSGDGDEGAEGAA